MGQQLEPGTPSVGRRSRLSRAARWVRGEPLKALLAGAAALVLFAVLVAGYEHFERYRVVGSYDAVAASTCTTNSFYVSLTNQGLPISTVGPASGYLVPEQPGAKHLRAGGFAPVRITVTKNDAGHVRYRLTSDAGDLVAMTWIGGFEEVCTG